MPFLKQRQNKKSKQSIRSFRYHARRSVSTIAIFRSSNRIGEESRPQLGFSQVWATRQGGPDPSINEEVLAHCPSRSCKVVKLRPLMLRSKRRSRGSQRASRLTTSKSISRHSETCSLRSCLDPPLIDMSDHRRQQR